MAGAKFDILFAGKLIGDADPEKARSQIQRKFKLSESVVERLFSGHTVAVKRGVDTATASRYRKIFRDANALIEIRPVNAPSQPQSASVAERTPESALGPSYGPEDSDSRVPPSPESSGRLPDREQPEYEHPEQTQTDARKAIDVSHLSLVPGNDWTFEDCQPQLPPIKLPNISHLEIVPLELDDDEE